MTHGIAVFDAASTQTLSMDDFTIQKLAVLIIPASKVGPTNGTRTDYILMDVPGYDPATCFVIITPRVYAGYSQPGYPDSWGYTPTFRDLGGTQIGIYTYVNRRKPTGVNGNYTDEWVQHVAESIVEVVKVS